MGCGGLVGRGRGTWLAVQGLGSLSSHVLPWLQHARALLSSSDELTPERCFMCAVRLRQLQQLQRHTLLHIVQCLGMAGAHSCQAGEVRDVSRFYDWLVRVEAAVGMGDKALLDVLG